MLSHIKKLIKYLTGRYEWLLSQLLRVRFNKVNREQYIADLISKHFKDNREELIKRAVETSPAEVLGEKLSKKVYRKMMTKYGMMVFFVSFLTTFPENFWLMIFACAFDLIFFQSLLFVAMQKIMMLYGTSVDLHKSEKESVQRIIAIDSSGLMIGKYPLLQKMKSVLGWLSRQLVKKIGPQLVSRLSKTAFVVLRRQGIKWGSLIITKENVDVALSALVPITCAAISGIVSMVIFIPMCNKLRRHQIELTKTKSESSE